MSKTKNKILIISFIIVLAWIWVVGGVVFLLNKDYYLETTETSTENRASSSIEVSEFWNSCQSLSDYVDDRIPFRNIFIRWYNAFNTKLDAKYQSAATKIGQHFYESASAEETSVEETVAEETTVAESDESTTQDEEQTDDYYAPVVVNDVIIGKNNMLFMYGENNIDYYLGNNLLSDEEMAAYAEKVNTLKEICDEKGINISLMFVPDKDQVYYQLMPTLPVETEYKRTARLVDYLSENTDMNVCYPLEELRKCDLSWQCYHVYDSHWNDIGAFTGVQAYYSSIGRDPVDPSTLYGEYHAAPNYDLAVMVGWDVTTLDDQYQWDVSYKDDVTVSGLDTSDTTYVCRTTSDSDNDENLVVIGDSFRTAMMQYLSKDFQNCTFAHRSNISEIDSDILNANRILIETVERQDYEAFDVIDYLITLLQ